MEDSGQVRMKDKIFLYLQEREAASLPPPTIEEIRVSVDVGSTSTVRNALEKLEKEKKITWMRGQSRSIRTTGGTADECRKVPVMNEDGSESGRAITVDKALLPDEEHLAVPGYMLAHDVVGDGGFVIIKEDTGLQEGNIIVTLEDGKYRLRRYHSFMLEALGADDPIVIDSNGTWPGECVLVGLAVMAITRWD